MRGRRGLRALWWGPGRGVLRSGCSEGSDGEVAPGGHRAGRVVGVPAVADKLGELGRGGLLVGQAGDGVDLLLRQYLRLKSVPSSTDANAA